MQTTQWPTIGSTSGYVVMLNGGPVIWSSKLQKVTAQSTAESECIAATECVNEVVHIRLLLSELGYADRVAEPTVIYEDNSSCVAYAHNLKNRKSAKTSRSDYASFRSRSSQDLFDSSWSGASSK